MSKISCLIFDNQEDEIERISFSLTDNWRTIRNEHSHIPELDIRVISDQGSARKILQNPGHGIQLFLCDVLVPDRDGESQMHGLSLIRLAKSKPAIPVVIALSKGPDQKHAGDFFGKIMDSGADRFFEKGPFESKLGVAMTKEIVQLLEVQGLLRYLGRLHKEIGHEQSAALESAFENVGQSNLSAIANYFCFSEAAEDVYISALKPGLSGAAVFVARYSSSKIDLSKKGVLLKISRDPERLRQEFDTYQREVVAKQTFSSTLIVDFLSQKQPFEANGWGSLGSKFEHNATTLLSWLAQPGRSSSTVEDLLNDLFLRDGLGATYSATKTEVEGDAITITRKALITTHRSVRVLAAINELEELIKRHAAGFKLDLVKLLVTDGELGSISRSHIGKRTTSATQHGDLHGGNVLVVTTGSRNRPKVIDYANIATLPWATDIVRFVVDIVAGGFDSGVTSYEWTSLDRWRSVGDVLALGDITPEVDAAMRDQTACWAAITWMRRNVFQIPELSETPQHRAEYLIALGLELMRVSYRKEELPAPKRAFGLIAAELALRRAEQELSVNKSDSSCA